jgi:hypothetical protein
LFVQIANLRAEFADIAKQVRNLQGASSNVFSIGLARACAKFSHTAHGVLTDSEHNWKTQWEAKDSSAEVYHHYSSIEELRQEFGESEVQYFVIVGVNAVIVGIRIGVLLLVAFRATRRCNIGDWYRNLSICRVELGGIGYHKGFLSIIRENASALCAEISAICRKEPLPQTICLTGHSLGGAVAALTQSLWLSGNVLCDCLRLQQDIGPNCAATVSDSDVENLFLRTLMHYCISLDAYTFGAPMFARVLQVGQGKFLAGAFHLRRSGDFVCSLPPSCLGYSFYGKALNAVLPR